MSISLYKIKKWYKMLTGKSISHVNQSVGTCYSKEEIAGYYNDLTEKVNKDNPDILVPKYYVDTGEEIFFSIGIFQYGLAAFDLYLKTDEELFKKKFLACADWAISNQEENGGWKTFIYKNPDKPYSSMAQGEGISLLVRCYKHTNEKKYLLSAEKAKDFMLKSIENGGTTEYIGDDVYFYESTYMPLVLNGWIFSIWGIYDFCKLTHDAEALQILNRSLDSLIKKLPDFDIKYWSKYADNKSVCSPFYHKLHIEQLKVMYDLFGESIFNEYAQKWQGYLNKRANRIRAFIVKAFQKIFE